MIGVNSRRLATGFVAAIVMSSSGAVLAEPTYSTTKISVMSHDIDLSNAAGAAVLRERVNATIRQACGSTSFGGPVNYGTRDEAKSLDACSADAHAAVEPKLRQLIAAGNPRMASN